MILLLNVSALLFTISEECPGSDWWVFMLMLSVSLVFKYHLSPCVYQLYFYCLSRVSVVTDATNKRLQYLPVSDLR